MGKGVPLRRDHAGDGFVAPSQAGTEPPEALGASSFRVSH